MMEEKQRQIIATYGNKLRIRVCGFCIEDGAILLVNHYALNEKKDFWSPPGGGMEFGSSASENLEREFFEETGLIVNTGDFLMVHEYLQPPLHAIELFFRVTRVDGVLRVGIDPEMAPDGQIIKEVRFIPLDNLPTMPADTLHQVFRAPGIAFEVEKMTGYALWKKFDN